ncbi:TonB-dependent receptor [Methylomonas sp. UP202]|uniref:TonB-dependent siderophore receptor n=1 Tax=Methylomonas sp. UP202 TaxID=3040943 RepID=UPI0024797868|nr:TonB-dependent receptor [Methylomonas sp. UP202]WGS84776.1 TonB-dependent receptor [Methylomonas sp. UP202]
MPNSMPSIQTLTKGVLLWAWIQTGPVHAEAALAPPTAAFHISRQSLDTALVEFSLQSGLQVIASGQLTAGLMSPGVSGSYSTLQALQKILAGSGLVYRLNGETAVSLEPAPAMPSPPINTLPAINVTTLTMPDPAPNYLLPNASTATKTDTPIMNTPYSIKTVPKAVLDDQQVIRMDKALQNVAGVLPEASSALFRDSFTIRGFTTGNAILSYRDGVPFPQAYSNGLSSKRDPANLQQIEVLKGPGSLLFGRVEPGGVINVITKQPLATPYYALQQQFGSFGYYRTSLDATGPVTGDKRLLYRVNAANETTGSFSDFVNSNRYFIAPVLSWNLDARDQVTADFEYQRFDETAAAAIPALGKRPAYVPRDRNIGEPGFSANNGARVLAGFNWSHQFNDHWQLSQRFYYNGIRSEINGTFLRGNADSQGNISRGMGHQNVQSDNYFAAINLTGKLKTWDLKHTLLFGGDYYRADDVDPFDVRFIPGSFNVFKPVYGTISFDAIDPSQRVRFGVDAMTSWYGVYGQDQIELPGQLYALGGLRYDQANQFDHLLNSVAGDEQRVSPRGGLLWRPLPEWSLYGSYSENFGAQNGVNGAGRILPAQTAEQWEIGVKTEQGQGRFSASLAYYDLSKRNIAVKDPNNPLLMATIGAAESRGLELDVAGELLPGWRVIGGYSELFFAAITADTDASGGTGTQGHRLPNAPRHSGSLFSSFEFQSGILQGLKLGAGINAVSQRQGDQANSYQVPGYLLVNLLAGYSFKLGSSKFTAQLNIDNLFDRYYFVGSNTGNDIFFGPPRSFLGSIKVKF